MKILFVASGNKGILSPFVEEQARSLVQHGVTIEYFLIQGNGAFGYLGNIPKLRQRISSYKPDLIHAHYGLSGLLAVLQLKIPVVTTFHGSDIFVYTRNLFFSKIANILSKATIVVNQNMAYKLPAQKKIRIIPCAVDLSIFYPIPQKQAQVYFTGKISFFKKVVLFSSRFDYYEKNYPLAKAALQILGSDYRLIELKGYTRSEVNLLLNASDVALLTSISEGSPQFIKEAMAANRPIVSTDVGDVASVIDATEGCYLADYDPFDVAKKIIQAISFSELKGNTKGRERLLKLGLDPVSTAEKIFQLYQEVLENI